jgi:hypothetical protein
VFESRIYRAAVVPFLLAVLIAAFSLNDRPRPLTTTLAADAFDGTQAMQILTSLANRYPDRRPGSSGDESLAQHMQGALAGPNFQVSVNHVDAKTIDGRRTLTTVTALRPGTSDRRIVLLAHRDAAGRGSQAELSGTAALLEMAHVLAGRVTNRTIELVSTSGGSGGDAGAADFAAQAGSNVDAVLVLGNMAGVHSRHPQVVGWSNSERLAPLRLLRTVGDAVSTEVGRAPGDPSALEQFTRMAFPVSVGEQGPFNARRLPAVLIQASGELPPAAGERVDPARLQAFGRAALLALNALDTGPDIQAGTGTDILVGRLTLPAWPLRLLIGLLILPPLLTAIDGLARARRRRMPVGRSIGLVLSAAGPFAFAAGFVMLAGRVGVLGPAPRAPTLPPALPVNGTARLDMIAATLVFALGWWIRPWLTRHIVGPVRAGEETSIALLLIISAVATVAWVFNPFAAALIAPALQLWLLACAPELRRRRPVVLGLWALSLLPVAVLVISYVRQLALGPIEAARLGLALLAGGAVGPLTALLWSLALGCAVIMPVVVLLGSPTEPEPAEVTVRGPLTYAGPGSLGGTESALRR